MHTYTSARNVCMITCALSWQSARGNPSIRTRGPRQSSPKMCFARAVLMQLVCVIAVGGGGRADKRTRIVGEPAARQPTRAPDQL
jgi:hypothetical protein